MEKLCFLPYILENHIQARIKNHIQYAPKQIQVIFTIFMPLLYIKVCTGLMSLKSLHSWTYIDVSIISEENKPAEAIFQNRSAQIQLNVNGFYLSSVSVDLASLRSLSWGSFVSTTVKNTNQTHSERLMAVKHQLQSSLRFFILHIR